MIAQKLQHPWIFREKFHDMRGNLHKIQRAPCTWTQQQQDLTGLTCPKRQMQAVAALPIVLCADPSGNLPLHPLRSWQTGPQL